MRWTLAIVLAACSSNNAPATDAASAEVAKAQVFRFAIAGEPETLDPSKIRGIIGVQVMINVLEGLVEYPNGNGPVVPALARRWDLSKDGRTYTFHLRKDARWSNGEPVTATDVRWSWMRVLNPKSASPNADKLFLIEGARAYHTGRAQDVPAIEVVGPHTLRVRLAYVAPYFLDLAAFPCFRPVHRASVEKHGDRFTRPEHLVSSGPYRLAERGVGKPIVLRKDERYYGAKDVAIDEIQVIPVQENSTMVNLYGAGKLEWSGATDLPALQMASLSRRDDYREVPYNGAYFYLFNVARMPDPKVRRALGMAIDRAAIVKVLRGGLRAAPTYVPPLPGSKRPGGALRFDPEGARQLLAAAGGAPPSLQLLYNTNENHKRVAEMVQQMWKQHLGVTVELVNQEWKVYLKTMHNQDFQVARAGWIGIFLDPLAFLARWETSHGQNDSGWSDPEYDGLLEKARRESDPEARLTLLRGAESVLMERGPVLPIYWYAESYLVRERVRGMKPYILNLYPVKYLRLE